MGKQYLVGYDGSDSANRAFDLALEMARPNGGRVRVVMALRVTAAGSETCAVMMADGSSQRASELLDTLRNRAGDMRDTVDCDIAYGSPGDVLIGQIEAHAIDHLIIGHTAHGTLARWLLGSVSDDVLARANIPVTIVR